MDPPGPFRNTLGVGFWPPECVSVAEAPAVCRLFWLPLDTQQSLSLPLLCTQCPASSTARASQMSPDGLTLGHGRKQAAGNASGPGSLAAS